MFDSIKNFFANEWQIFMSECDAFKGTFKKIFGIHDEVLMLSDDLNNEADKQAESTEGINLEDIKVDDFKLDDIKLDDFSSNENNFNDDIFDGVNSDLDESKPYEFDAIDCNISAYLGEDIESTMQNMSGDKTQHEVLRSYAKDFKPYNINYEMCNEAFRKYYGKHALDIATEVIPTEHLRMVQNNMDIFIDGQENLGENAQFVDCRVDTLLKKVDVDTFNKVTNILCDNLEGGINFKGERLFAESISLIVDKKVRVAKDCSNLLDSIKIVFEDRLNDTREVLRKTEGMSDDIQRLVSEERKYYDALNRIQQYEEEQKILEFEEKIDDMMGKETENV